MKKIVFILLFLGLFLNSSLAKDMDIPEFKSRIVDTTKTLAPQELQDVENRLAQLDKNGTIHLAVLIVSSTKPYEISEYSIAVARKWKVGEKDKNNGLLLTIAIKDRKSRLEVGRGLEGDIPDITAKKILRDTFIPAYKQYGLYTGIKSTIDSLGSHMKIKSSIPDGNTSVVKSEVKKEEDFKYMNETIIIASVGIIGGLICAASFPFGIFSSGVVSSLMIVFILATFSFLVLFLSLLLAIVIGAIIRGGGFDWIPFIDSSSFGGSSSASFFDGGGGGSFDGGGASAGCGGGCGGGS